MRTGILELVIMLKSAVATDFLATIANTTAATTVTAPLLNGVTSTSLCYLWRARLEDSAFGNCTDVDLAGITDIYTSARGRAITIVNRNTGETNFWYQDPIAAKSLDDNHIWNSKRFSNVTEIYNTGLRHLDPGAFIGFSRQTGTAECWGCFHRFPEFSKADIQQWNCSNIDFAGVTDIYSNDYAFVLLNKNTGQAQCYGDAFYGGNCTLVNFTGVTDVYSAGQYFIALNNNTGQVQCWGQEVVGIHYVLHRDCTGSGGLNLLGVSNSSSLNLLGVSDVYTTKDDDGTPGILALNRMAGTALCWGFDWKRQVLCEQKEFNYKNYSGSCYQLPNLCSGIDFAGVTDVYASESAFLALNKNTGKAQCVGYWRIRGDWQEADCKDMNFTGITDVYGASDSFLALNARTGETMCIPVGAHHEGGDCSDVDLPTLDAGVTDVYTNNEDTFIAVNSLTGKAQCLWSRDSDCWPSPWADRSWNGSELYIDDVVRLKSGAFIVYAPRPPSPPRPFSWCWIALGAAICTALGCVAAYGFGMCGRLRGLLGK